MKQAIFHITYKCNLRCPYCWTFQDEWGWEHAYPFISSEKWVEAWNKTDVDVIDLAGGEPMLQPRLWYFINNAKQKFHLTSNIMEVDEFIEKVNPLKILGIVCSLHYYTKKGFSAKQLIKFDMNLRKLTNAGFHCRVNFVAWPGQVEDIPAMHKKYKKMGFDFHVEPFFCGTKLEKYEGVFKIIMESFSPLDRMHNVTEDEVAYLCTAGIETMIVLPNGDIYPCTMHAWKGWYKMGNLFTGYSLLPTRLHCKTDFCMGCDYDKVYREVMDG